MIPAREWLPTIIVKVIAPVADELSVHFHAACCFDCQGREMIIPSGLPQHQYIETRIIFDHALSLKRSFQPVINYVEAGRLGNVEVSNVMDRRRF
jgi:hypothetical protein